MYLAIFLTCMKLLNAVLNVFQVNTNTSERGHSTLRHVTSMHLFIHDFDQAFLCLAAEITLMIVILKFPLPLHKRFRFFSHF